jgi:hypothetical protein
MIGALINKTPRAGTRGGRWANHAGLTKQLYGDLRQAVKPSGRRQVVKKPPASETAKWNKQVEQGGNKGCREGGLTLRGDLTSSMHPGVCVLLA